MLLSVFKFKIFSLIEQRKHILATLSLDNIKSFSCSVSRLGLCSKIEFKYYSTGTSFVKVGSGVGYSIGVNIIEPLNRSACQGACGNSSGTGADIAPKPLPNHTSRSISGSKCRNSSLNCHYCPQEKEHKRRGWILAYTLPGNLNTIQLPPTISRFTESDCTRVDRILRRELLCGKNSL